jgi:Rrf2 family protein
MSASTKLSTSIEALCVLAGVYPHYRTSNQISAETGVNASKVRWLLSKIQKRGIIRSTKGMRGGFCLNRHPRDINLQEIYCAVEDRKAFHLQVNGISTPDFPGARINAYFLHLFSDIQQTIEDKMQGITLEQVMASVDMVISKQLNQILEEAT